MNEAQIRDSLLQLAQVEVDAVHACERTIGAVDALALHGALGDIRRDHERHAAELARAIEERGGEPPQGPNLEGRLLALLTALRSMVGTEGALRALLDNERLTTGEYARALVRPWPDDLLERVRTWHADEERHLSLVERWLESRAWEAGAHP